MFGPEAGTCLGATKSGPEAGTSTDYWCNRVRIVSVLQREGSEDNVTMRTHTLVRSACRAMQCFLFS